MTVEVCMECGDEPVFGRITALGLMFFRLHSAGKSDILVSLFQVWKAA